MKFYQIYEVVGYLNQNMILDPVGMPDNCYHSQVKRLYKLRKYNVGLSYVLISGNVTID